MTHLLDLCTLFYNPRPVYLSASGSPIPSISEDNSSQDAPCCVWRKGKKPATLRAMRRLSLLTDRLPPLPATNLNLSVHLRHTNSTGPMSISPLIDSKRHKHLAAFCSYVPLHNWVSPARIAALFVAVRLFPSLWRRIFEGAFGVPVDERVAKTVNRFTEVFGSPAPQEGIEHMDIFHCYHRTIDNNERAALFREHKPFLTAVKQPVKTLCRGSHVQVFRASMYFVAARPHSSRRDREAFVDFLTMVEALPRREAALLRDSWSEMRTASEQQIVRIVRCFRFTADNTFKVKVSAKP